MSPRILDLTGQRFGMLTALSRLSDKEDRYYQWECLCDCGGLIQVSTKKLMRGTITNCGCIPKTTVCNGTIAEDITGQTFGLLTAVKRVESRGGKTQWLCNCTCGNTKIATTSMLKAGHTWHCGCETEKTKYSTKLDLEGKRFGRLVAVRITDKRNTKGSVIWECLCDCGEKVEIPCEFLVSGNTTSCGCRKQEIKDSIGDQLTFVDGTCIEWLRSRKHRSDNTSGFRGVNKAPNGKWRASIGFKRERYHIGCFESFEEAKAARLKAEQILHDGFVLAWEKWNAIANADPDWASENPFIFEVFWDNGEVRVYSPILDSTKERNRREKQCK